MAIFQKYIAGLNPDEITNSLLVWKPRKGAQKSS